jgi:hypothetical protein
MIVLTIVTEATSEMALPLSMVCAEVVVLFAGEDNVTPAVAIIVPTMVPPPA